MSDGSTETAAFVLTPLARVSARLRPHDWPWARENAAQIVRHWQVRREARPSLFDGSVFLACGHVVDGDTCRLDLFETGFSRFLAFRDLGSPDPGVWNAFAAIVAHTADGAVLLGQMGAHTANAGQIYFPCGTPDPNDLRPDGRVDLAGSAAREFAEETGLAPPDPHGHPWLLVRGAGQLAFLRPVRFDMTAQTLLDRIAAHHARDTAPELARMVAARKRGDLDSTRMPGFVRAYLTRVLPA